MEIATVHLPLDDAEDREFWDVWASGPQFGTPLYYLPHLERSAAVLTAIARAPPGGVAFHCVGGRDRTGQITMLLLALAGVSARDIAADYALSTQHLRARYEARGEDDQGPLIEAFLEGEGTTAAEVVVDTVGSLDVEARLRAGGLAEQDLTGLRGRLVGP